jgi:hypothetical protein
MAAAWELSGAERTGDSAQDAARARVWANHRYYAKGYVVVAVDDDGPMGVTEGSFSMDASRSHVRFWREREDKYEGRKNAEHYRDHFNGNGRHEAKFEVYDIDDPACPVMLDFIHYEQLLLNGRINKYDDRNLRIVPITRARLFFKENA